MERDEWMHVSCADVFIHLLLFNVLTIPLDFGIFLAKFELYIKKAVSFPKLAKV